MKILIILLWFISVCVSAQQISFSGKVVDAETELPLENVNISVSSKPGVGTFTDSAGLFTLTNRVENTDTLLVSAIGYETGVITLSSLLKFTVDQPTDKKYFIHSISISKLFLPKPFLLRLQLAGKELHHSHSIRLKEKRLRKLIQFMISQNI